MSTTTIITGAGGGIGAATARVLAGSGHAVALLDLTTETTGPLAEELRAAGGEAIAVECDVLSPDAVEAALDKVEEALPPVTSLVTAAGIIHKEEFLDLSVDAWKLTMDINLTGTWLLIQRVARRMVEGGRKGAFVALSSVAGRGPRANAADYAASKAGVISVCRSAGVALAPKGIRVNAVCPGVVDTPMTDAIHEQNSRELGISYEESLAQLVAKIPLGTVVSPAEVGGVIRFLLSDEAAYITGQAVNICGGLEFN